MTTDTPAGDLGRKLWIGASGYSYDDWVGPFYPPGTAKADFLAYYAERFPVVEVNATYYRIPPPRSFEAMVRRSPPGFLFVVKANQEMTHRGSRDPALYRSFLESIEPLRRADKFDGVLFQFPFAFRNDAAERSHLAFVRRACPGMRLWAEFRHESWNRPAVFDYLRRLDVGYCAVDEPGLPGLMPGVAAATSDTGYVRFHGRNRDTWWGGGHERYDWDYRPQELSEWLDRIRDLVAETERTYVFFNNCYMGRAVKSARILRRLLGLPPLDAQTDLELG
jgi:uncharacterized protein YecE (DUF72 family)